MDITRVKVVVCVCETRTKFVQRRYS